MSGIIYFIAWGMLSIVWVWPYEGKMQGGGALIWALAWAAFGIGAGLINTRTLDNGKRDRQYKHYLLLYYPFAWIVTFLLALLMASSLSHSSFENPSPEWDFWVILLALILGLFAENLGQIASEIVKKFGANNA
jgi:membrane protease YdiL (CAAX protease family)